MNIKYFEAADNPMFPPEITLLIRFVRADEKIKCPVCGKTRKKLWTMLVPFKGRIFQSFAMAASEELPALTPICEDHPMEPIFISLAKKIANPALNDRQAQTDGPSS